jgi:hypothetical protein
VWDLGAQRIFSALRLKILMPGAKNQRQPLRSHILALSHPGEGVNLLSAFALPSEKIDTLLLRGSRQTPKRNKLWSDNSVMPSP